MLQATSEASPGPVPNTRFLPVETIVQKMSGPPYGVQAPKPLFPAIWLLRGVLLCALGLVVGYLVYRYVRRWVKVWKALRPLPGPTDKHPLWFMFAVYMSRRKRFTQQDATFEFSESVRGLCEMFKNRTFKAYIAAVPIVVIQTADHAEVLLSSAVNLNKPFFYTFTIPWLGPRNLLYVAGDIWRAKRKVQTPGFHFKILEKFMAIFNEHADAMSETLHDMSVKKEQVRINDITKRCSLDVIAEALLGINLNTQKNDNGTYGEYIGGITFLMTIRAFRPWMWLTSIYNWSLEGRWFKKMIDGVDSFSLKVMKERKETFHLFKNQSNPDGPEDEDDAKPERRVAILDILLDKHLKDQSYTLHEIRKDLDLLLFAGHDTISNAMAWTLYLLGLHPQKQRKVQRELDEIFKDDPDREVTMDDLRRMKYLEACLKEAMRLFPPIPYIGRVLVEDIELDGVVIPKGVTCWISIFTLHRNEKYFHKPEEFIPERFLTEEFTSRHPFSYIPFSAGSKNCIGQRFAMREGKVILAKVLRSHTFKATRPLDKLKISCEVVTKAKGGLRVHVKKRLPGDYECQNVC